MKNDIFYIEKIDKLPLFLRFYERRTIDKEGKMTHNDTNKLRGDYFGYYNSEVSSCNLPSKPISKLLKNDF